METITFDYRTLAQIIGVSERNLKETCVRDVKGKEAKLEGRKVYIEQFGFKVISISTKEIELSLEGYQTAYNDLQLLKLLGLSNQSLSNLEAIKKLLTAWLVDKEVKTNQDLAAELNIDPSLISYWKGKWIEKNLIVDGFDYSFFKHVKGSDKKEEATEAEWKEQWSYIKAINEKSPETNAFRSHYFTKGFIITKTKIVQGNALSDLDQVLELI